jgi:hypothetical protein
MRDANISLEANRESRDYPDGRLFAAALMVLIPLAGGALLLMGVLMWRWFA